MSSSSDRQESSYGGHVCVDQQKSKRSRRSVFCPCCNKTFSHITSQQEMIALHMEVTPCASSIIECNHCNKKFMTQSNFMKHINNVSNPRCKQVHLQSELKKSYCTTKVALGVHEHPITPMNERKNLDKRANSKENATPLEIIHHQRDVGKLKIPWWSIKKHKPKDCAPKNKSTKCSTYVEKISNNDEHRSDTREANDSFDNESSNFQCNNDCPNQLEQSNDGSKICRDDENKMASTNRDSSVSNSNEGTSADNNSQTITPTCAVPNNDSSTSMLSCNNMSLGQQSHADNATSSQSNQRNISDEDKFFDSDDLLNIYNIKREETSKFFDDESFLASIMLLQLLIDKQMSLNHYDDFMKWLNIVMKRNSKYLSLDTVFYMCTQRTYGRSLCEKMSPKVVPVELVSGRSCTVIKFDVKSMVFDMLDNSNLTCSSNMIFDGNENNPFEISINSMYDDIDSSTVYQRTFHDLNIDTEKHVLCPIGLYIDELKMDAFSKMGLEPVVMTLLIYNRKTRNQHYAHRVIGYIPNLNNLADSKSYTPDEKSNDYHQILGLIINDIKRLQDKNGYNWIFKLKEYPNQVFQRKLIFPLFYVIGDAKGNDMLAGRQRNWTSATHIARDCNALLASCDNTDIRCTFHRQCLIEKMNTTQLKGISFCNLKSNAFKNFWFGSQPYGINAALPPEPLHMFNLGIVERLAWSLIQTFGEKKVHILDNHTAYICTHFSRQSDRDYPNIETFNTGISDASKLTANEKVARIFAIYLTLLTSDMQKEISVNIESVKMMKKNIKLLPVKEYNDWLTVIEQTLIFWSWLYRENHNKIFFKGGRNSVAAKRVVAYMSMYKEKAPRKGGNGLKLIKFHHLSHMWWVIRMFGSLLNVDGARGESNNQFLAKNPGKLTQRHHSSLVYQTACQTFKRDSLIRCIEETLPNDGQMEVVKVRDLKPHTLTGSPFKIVFDYKNKTAFCYWTGYKMKDRKCDIPPLILNSVYHKLSGYNGGDPKYRIESVTCHCEYITNSTSPKRVRAHPFYRGCHSWYDWVNVSWNNNDEVVVLPAQILMFINMSTVMFKEIPHNNDATEICHDKIPWDIIAIVHSASERRSSKTMPLKGGGGFSSELASWYKMEDSYQMINAASIESECFVIVDTHNSNTPIYSPGTATRIITIEKRKLWSKHFINYDNENLIHEAETSNDETVTEECLRPYES